MKFIFYLIILFYYIKFSVEIIEEGTVLLFILI